MANLYYREDLDASAFQPGALIEVTGEEARHAVRVSRLREGERILVGNGAGVIGAGEVELVAKDRFAVRLASVDVETDPEQRLVLVQALAKGDRDERAVEQATEFGIDAIVPWEAARSVSRWRAKGGDGADKTAKGVEKWQRIAREASKQSLRPRVPEVRRPATLAELCAVAADSTSEVLVLHPRGEHRLTDWVGDAAACTATEILVVIGPEGGFADEELDALETAGARIVLLGETVLRTSSAGPAALAVLNGALGRW